MHGGIEQNKDLLSKVVKGTVGIGKAAYAVCVPYPYLSQVQSLLKNTHISWGAQNISQYDKGAYTGEVSAMMLSDFCCHYVLLDIRKDVLYMVKIVIQFPLKFKPR